MLKDKVRYGVSENVVERAEISVPKNPKPLYYNGKSIYCKIMYAILQKYLESGKRFIIISISAERKPKRMIRVLLLLLLSSKCMKVQVIHCLEQCKTYLVLFIMKIKAIDGILQDFGTRLFIPILQNADGLLVRFDGLQRK